MERCRIASFNAPTIQGMASSFTLVNRAAKADAGFDPTTFVERRSSDAPCILAPCGTCSSMLNGRSTATDRKWSFGYLVDRDLMSPANRRELAPIDQAVS